MVEVRPASPTAVATALALAAAFVWATYYFFVLDLESRGVGTAPNLAYPFVVGGIAYLAATFVVGQGARFVELLRTPTAYGRVVLLVAMQVLVIAGTDSAGPVDTSLLTLVGDTVLTPILVLSIFAEGRERLASGAFLAGVAFCTVGAALAIVGGSGARSIAGLAWAVVPLLPVVIAVYFLWVARIGRRIATEPLLAHSTTFGALAVIVASLALPGGVAAMTRLDAGDVALLAINGFLSFYVGPWLYFRAIRSVGMILPAVLMSTIPVFTLALGVVLDRSVPPLLGLVGVPLAVLGAVLAMRGESAVAANAPAAPIRTAQ